MIFKSIRGKLFLGTFFLIVLISLCFLTFLIYQTNNFTKNTLIDFGFHLVQDLSHGSEIGIASEDPVLLQPTFGRVFEEKDVILVTVYNKKGQIVASKKKTDIEERISEDIMKEMARGETEVRKIGFTQAGEEIFDFYAPILTREQEFPFFEKPGELIGFTRVALSLESSKEQKRELLFFGLAITTLLVFFGAVISFVFAKKITDPFGILMQGTKVIAKGNLDYQIKLKTGDEIEELAESFNRMTEDLKRSRARLEESKTVLEIKIKARTSELEGLTEQQERIIKERTKDLQERIKELEKFHQLAIGRELKMIELKEEIKKLKEELEKSKGRE